MVTSFGPKLGPSSGYNNNNNNNNNIIRDNEKRKCILIDVAISGESNVIKKEAEKF